MFRNYCFQYGMDFCWILCRKLFKYLVSVVWKFNSLPCSCCQIYPHVLSKWKFASLFRAFNIVCWSWIQFCCLYYTSWVEFMMRRLCENLSQIGPVVFFWPPLVTDMNKKFRDIEKVISFVDLTLLFWKKLARWKHSALECYIRCIFSFDDGRSKLV